MGKFDQCHFCTEINLATDYASCKLANGNPCKSCTDGIELDALIAQAKSNLDALITRKPDLHREINRSHELIVRHLPPEVSALIFRFSLSEDLPSSYLDIQKRSPSSRVLTTPLTLGAVCRTWRNIVWASPCLWTNISIPVKYNSDLGFDIAREWVTRSGQLPLSISIYTPRPPGQCAENPRKRLSEFLQLWLSRCRRLEFTCPIAFIPSFSGDAPLLEEIKIASNEEIGKSDARRIIIHSTKPEGVRLSVSGYNLDSLELPFAQVNEFEGLLSLDQCLSTFKKSPNLLECRIRGFAYGGAPSNLGSPITHDRLEKLTLLSTRTSSSRLLDMVNLPGLTHLTASNVSTTTIRKFVLRSYCSLRYLRLDSLDREDGPLCEMLRSTQSLEELYIVDDSELNIHINALFKSLSQAPLVKDPECLLPNLSVLNLTFREEVDFPWDLAPRIFGSLDDLRDPFRRPLKQFQVTYAWRMGHYRRVDPEEFLGFGPLFSDEKFTRRFLDIAHEGVDINFYVACSKDEILRRLMGFHNISVPGWYQIKESFGDSDLETLGIETHYLTSEEPELTDYDSDATDDSEQSDDDSADYEVGSDISDASYDPYYGLPSNITGATVDML